MLVCLCFSTPSRRTFSRKSIALGGLAMTVFVANTNSESYLAITNTSCILALILISNHVI